MNYLIYILIAIHYTQLYIYEKRITIVMKQDVTSLRNQSYRRKNGDGIATYNRLVIYIPSKIWNDSSFPFRIDEKLNISIDGDKLILEKIKK